MGLAVNLSEAEHFDEDLAEVLRMFVKANGLGEDIPAEGITLDLYSRIMSDTAVAFASQRKTLQAGDTGAIVDELQKRLFDLNCYQKGKRTSVVDDDMLAAVKNFAQANQIEFDGITIPVETQDAILRDDVKSYDVAVEEGGFMTRPMSVLGLQLPTYLVIVIAVLLVAGLAVLLIFTFSGGKKRKETGADNISGFNSSGGGGSVVTSGGGSGVTNGNGRKCTVELSYMGNTKTATVDLSQPLRIGRGENTLPLDSRDTDISRKHCQVSLRGNYLILRDYSTNGTRVNGVNKHNCETVISEYDTVNIGGHNLKFKLI